MKSVSHFLISLSIFAASSVCGTFSLAMTCEDVHLAGQTRVASANLVETRYLINEVIVAEPKLNLNPIQAVSLVGEMLFDRLAFTIANKLPVNSRFAINLSKDNYIHIVTYGLPTPAHTKLVETLQRMEVDKLLSNIPVLFRNKYFEVSVASDSHGYNYLKILPMFAWELSFPLQSHILTGFATKQTDLVRPYTSQLISPHEKIREDLMQQKTCQQTFATCGLASFLKTAIPKGMNISEKQLLELTNTFRIKELEEVFGSNPGLSLTQLAKFLTGLGRQLNFSVTEVQIKGPADMVEFEKAVIAAANGKGVDVIVNYASPVVGRPGGGHFTPIGGFNTFTKEVLLSEVNIAMNPPFWVHVKNLFNAMMPQKVGDSSRGYIIINWN